MILVELVEPFGLVGGLAERLEEAGVAEDQDVADLRADSSREGNDCHKGSGNSERVDERGRDIRVDLSQRRGGQVLFDKVEHRGEAGVGQELDAQGRGERFGLV